MGDLTARKELSRANGEQAATQTGPASYSALLAILDGQHANMSLTLPFLLEKVIDDKTEAGAALALPKAENLIFLVLSPDAAALPSGRVVTSPAEATNCR